MQWSSDQNMCCGCVDVNIHCAYAEMWSKCLSLPICNKVIQGSYGGRGIEPLNNSSVDIILRIMSSLVNRIIVDGAAGLIKNNERRNDIFLSQTKKLLKTIASCFSLALGAFDNEFLGVQQSSITSALCGHDKGIKYLQVARLLI